MENIQSDEGDWTDKVCSDVFKELGHQWSTFRANLDAIFSPGGNLVSLAVHERVTNLLEEIFKDPWTKLEGPSGDLRTLSSALMEAAANVLRIVDPTVVYLETILMGELSVEPSRTAVSPDAAQAGFAAAALAEIARASDSLDPEDLHLRAAAELASSMLSERGAVPSRTAFDVSGKGYRLPPQSAETIRTICDMLRFLTSDCYPESARRLVRHFLETRAGRPGTQPGWHSDGEPRKPKAEVWATALAFLALFDLRMMLDLQINRRVLRHFAMRRPRELKLGLDQLFLPDAVSARKDPESSIGVQLQRMRTHVEGATSSRDDFSLVLYGPPGTGKSTLLEAVAKSSACAYVEITSSDILIGGTEQIERRTRIVFSALSMLSHCVILFDEFDSILRTRSRDRGPIRSRFQFLTPGLLPKLKHLHERAEKQRLAYALATNYVGDLDRAAIRRGRFDRQVGIFPPDFLSRLGRLATEMWTYHGKELNTEGVKRAIKVINASAGYGMATLGKPIRSIYRCL
jgi:ATPase family associated with various cellular activities (AAA)